MTESELNPLPACMLVLSPWRCFSIHDERLKRHNRWWEACRSTADRNKSSLLLYLNHRQVSPGETDNVLKTVRSARLLLLRHVSEPVHGFLGFSFSFSVLKLKTHTSRPVTGVTIQSETSWRDSLCTCSVRLLLTPTGQFT